MKMYVCARRDGVNWAEPHAGLTCPALIGEVRQLMNRGTIWGLGT